MHDKYTVTLEGKGWYRDRGENFPGWDNFERYCDEIFRKSDAVCLDTIIHAELKKQFGDRYPCVKVIRPRTYKPYVRFRSEKEYLLFVLRWA